MKPVKCILIDAYNRTITEVEQSGLKDIYKLLRVSMIEAVYLGSANMDCIYVDEEGLLNGTEASFKFRFPGKPSQVFMGSGLVVGVNRANGNDAPPKISIEEVRKRVSFPVL